MTIHILSSIVKKGIAENAVMKMAICRGGGYNDTASNGDSVESTSTQQALQRACSALAATGRDAFKIIYGPNY